MGLNLLKNLMSSRMPYLVLSSVVLARLTMPPPLSAFSAWTRVVLAILAKPAAYSSSALSAMTSTAPNVSGTYTYRCCTTVRSLVLASPEGVCHSRTRFSRASTEGTQFRRSHKKTLKRGRWVGEKSESAAQRQAKRAPRPHR